MVKFKFLGRLYRTNDDATLIEVHTSDGWFTTDADVKGAAAAAVDAHNEMMARVAGGDFNKAKLSNKSDKPDSNPSLQCQAVEARERLLAVIDDIGP